MSLASCVLLLLAVGCSGGETSPREDLGLSQRDLTPAPDISPRQDIGVPFDTQPTGDATVDTLQPDTAPTCTTGTADNCSQCGDKCPGPVGTQHTQRVCISPDCSIQCLDEHYDVNGQVVDGCEAMDDVPIHDSEPTSANMGTFSDCKGTQSTQAVMPSDEQLHVQAPNQRQNGRADWFKLKIEDNAGCSVEAKVAVKLTSLHPSATFRVTAQYVCNDSTRLAQKSTSIQGGQTANLTPDTGCSFGGFGDDGGIVYISVTKLVGQHSAANYTVEVEP